MGVGGQGVILLGNLLRQFGLKSPFIKSVVGTETRGVSQREGSVIATARYLIDSKIYNLDQGYEIDDLISPTIPINDAHIVIGLEPLETIRNLKFISEQTVVVLNTNKRYPRDVVAIGCREGAVCGRHSASARFQEICLIELVPRRGLEPPRP